jgi:hypothetical protein
MLGRVKLTSDERELLARGLLTWGGPADPTPAILALMGFADQDDLHRRAPRIAAALRADEPLEPADQIRALSATEIVFVSDRHGAGVEWETVTGLSDEETIRLLRAVQRKLEGAR